MEPENRQSLATVTILCAHLPPPHEQVKREIGPLSISRLGGVQTALANTYMRRRYEYSIERSFGASE